ncbi:hypothetical protein CBM2626_A60324 [Cupriavidus taiwanensis]|nr:hypothetical protein CBM2626_A60324 [Cupriavidus taiwanensis]
MRYGSSLWLTPQLTLSFELGILSPYLLS